SKSIPLLITLTGYSFKNDFFTKLASQFEGVTIVKFFIPVKASFFLLKLSLELLINQLVGYSFFWMHFSFLSVRQHSQFSYSKYVQCPVNGQQSCKVQTTGLLISFRYLNNISIFT